MRVLDKGKGGKVDEAQVKTLIETALKDVKGGNGLDIARLVDSLTNAIHGAVEGALKAADEARLKAEATAKEVQDSKVAADEKAKLDEARIRQEANSRAQLLHDLRDVLPDDDKLDKPVHDMTDRELMLVALGDALPDAKSRTDDFLRGYLSTIIKDRRAAAGNRQSVEDRSVTGVPRAPTGAPTTVMGLRDQVRRARVAGRA